MIGNVNSACIDKPQLKAMAKSKAKAWAEVGYIITTHARPTPVLQKVSTASTISPFELKFSW